MSKNSQRRREQKQPDALGPLSPAGPSVPLSGPVTKTVQANQSLTEILKPHFMTTILPIIQRIERARDSRVITYFLGELAAIADEQVLHLYEHLRRIGKQPRIDLWLSSRGGATETPWRVVALLREYADHLAVLVPYRAHSSATLISLGADEIVMTEMSELGPIDPSRRHPLLPREEESNGERTQIPISVQDLRHVLKFLEREIGKDHLTADAAATIYTALFDKVHPLAIGALEQSWALSRQVAEQVLSTHMDTAVDGAKIAEIVECLSDDYKSHTYQINRREAKRIGLKVVDAPTDVSALMWELYLAYHGLNITAEIDTPNGKFQGTRLGHIDSTAGLCLGLGLVGTKGLAGARWEPSWIDAVPAPAP